MSILQLFSINTEAFDSDLLLSFRPIFQHFLLTIQFVPQELYHFLPRRFTFLSRTLYLPCIVNLFERETFRFYYLPSIYEGFQHNELLDCN